MRTNSLIPLAGLAATGANAFLLPPNLDAATLRVTEDIKINSNDENVKPLNHDGWGVKVPCNNCFYEPTGSSDAPTSLMFAITADKEKNQLKLAGKTIWPATEHDTDFVVTQTLDDKSAEGVDTATLVRPSFMVLEEDHTLSPEMGGRSIKLDIRIEKINDQAADIPDLSVWAFQSNDGTLELAAVGVPPKLAPGLVPLTQCEKFDFFCRVNRVLSSAKQGGKDVMAKLPFMPMPFHRAGAKKPCKGAKGHGRPFHLNGGIDKFAESVTPFHPHHHDDKLVGEFAGSLSPFHPHHHHNHDDKVFSGAIGMVGRPGPHHGGPGPLRQGMHPHPPCFRAKMAHLGHVMKHVLFTFILPILAGMTIGVVVPAIVMMIFSVLRAVFFPRRAEVVVPAVIVTEYEVDEKSAFKRSDESGEESEKAALMAVVEEDDLPPYVAKE